MRRSILTIAQIFVSGTILLSFANAKELAQDKLTLADAVREALANNPSIASAWRKWNAARARIVQEKAWDDPRVSAGFTAARFVKMAPNSMVDQTLTLEQIIPISGKNLSRGRAAAAEALVAFEDFRRQQLDVVSKLKITYFQLFNTRIQLAINARNLISLQQIAAVSQAKYRVGTEAAPEALTAEIEATKLEQERSNLERTQSEAQTRLNVLMNRPASLAVGELDTDRPASPQLLEKDLMSLLLSSRPEIRIARSKIDAEKARLQLAKRGWIPDPAINISAQRYDNSTQAVSQLEAGISFNLPWANPEKYSAAVREADENVEAANAEFQAVKSESLGLLHDQLVRVEAAHHHYELYSGKILPQAQQAFDTIQFNYETGKSSFANWITTQRSLRDIRATENNMLTDYETAVAELEAIVGAKLPASPPKKKGTFHSHPSQ